MRNDPLPGELTGADVLIVEDEEPLADLYEAWLAADHDVTTVYTGREAVAELDPATDVVILDRRLPDTSGRRILEYVEEQALDCMITIVSAVEPEFEVAHFPIDEYLVKPIEREELQATVEELRLRSQVDVTRRDLLALYSRKLVLETESTGEDLRSSREYRALGQAIDVLESKLGVSPQEISSNHRPDACPECGLRWNLDLEGTVGFVSMASRVWKCVECGRVVHRPDPTNQSVTRGR
jgi:DNA-binding response OmpR family regulator